MHADGVRGARPELAVYGDVERFIVWRSECDTRKRTMRGGAQDGHHAAQLITNLDAQRSGNIKPSFRVHGHAVCAALHVRRRGWNVQVAKRAFERQGSVGLYLIRVDVATVAVADVEQSLIRR